MHDPDFLRAIIENPYDDGLRLVYADWLEEHGHRERADFIRYQIVISGFTEDDAKFQEINKSYAHLDRSYTHGGVYQSTWNEECPKLPKGAAWGPYRRGFPDTIILFDECDVLKIDEALFDEVPFIRLILQNWLRDQDLHETLLFQKTRELCFLRKPDEENWSRTEGHYESLATVLSWYELEQLEELDIQDPYGTITNFEPIGLTPFSRLKRFRYRGNYHELNPQLDNLSFEATWFSELTHLSLTNLCLTSPLIKQMCQRLQSGKLTHLTLEHCRLDDQIFDFLLQASIIQNLKYLNIGDNNLTESILPRLIELLPADARLHARNNPLASKVLSHLVKSAHLQRLAQFPKGYQPIISPVEASILQQSRHAEDFPRIEIQSSHSESVDWHALLDSTKFRSLQMLQITDARLVSVPPLQFPELSALRFQNCHIDDLNEFASSSNLPKLQYLSLLSTVNELQSIHQLSSTFGQLLVLDLSDSRISEEELIRFLRAKPFNQMYALRLQGCPVTDRFLQTIPYSPLLATCNQISILDATHLFHNTHFSPQVYFQTVLLCRERKVQIDNWSTEGLDSSSQRILRTVPDLPDPLDTWARKRLLAWLNTTECMCGYWTETLISPSSYYGEVERNRYQRNEQPLMPPYPYQERLRRFLQTHQVDQESHVDRTSEREAQFQRMDRATFARYFAEIMPNGTQHNGPMVYWIRPRFSDEADLDEFFSPAIGTPTVEAPAYLYRDLVMNRMFPHENTGFFGSGLGEEEERVLLIFDDDFTGLIRGHKFTFEAE